MSSLTESEAYKLRLAGAPLRKYADVASCVPDFFQSESPFGDLLST